MHWMYKHKNAYRKAMESFHHLSWYPSKTFPTGRYSDWDGGNPSDAEDYSTYTPNSRARYPSWPQQYPDAHYSTRVTKNMGRDSEMEKDSESEEEIECDLTNMEITEELRQYFAQTEAHRQELRKQQELEAEHQDMYVEADHDLHLTTRRSVQPPAERPGERRMAEMKKLYGVGAAKIQAMETAMQLAFDRNCDKKQPKYWPVIPLKLPYFLSSLSQLPIAWTKSAYFLNWVPLFGECNYDSENINGNLTLLPQYLQFSLLENTANIEALHRHHVPGHHHCPCRQAPPPAAPIGRKRGTVANGSFGGGTWSHEASIEAGTNSIGADYLRTSDISSNIRPAIPFGSGLSFGSGVLRSYGFYHLILHCALDNFGLHGRATRFASTPAHISCAADDGVEADISWAWH
ncbi:Gem-associated protein 8 [Chelonia mydas]|uniref:Gem-associated protein 8 n=1 Tax=Chelonia mydas TaxID=8469 RepID=M7BIL9_CHEMY|nr:Gem-associated protein 8 [Chelonia mydas]